MNVIAELVETEERIARLGSIVSAQSVRLARFRELYAPGPVIRQASRLLSNLEDRIGILMERRRWLLGELDREPGSVVGCLRLGMNPITCVVEELCAILDSPKIRTAKIRTR